MVTKVKSSNLPQSLDSGATPTLAGTNFSSIPNGALSNSTISGVALGGTLGTLTLNVSGNGLSGSQTYNGGSGQTFTVSSNATENNTGNTIVWRNGSGDFSAGTMSATATAARYADLAEKYLSDDDYAAGTVLIFGGNKEVTQSSSANDKRVAGVVSSNPAHLMNDQLEGGMAVALTGRVPCKVVGLIYKGDLMVTSGIPGVAMANNDAKIGTVIGKALEDYQSTEVGVIEVVVGRV
jgi:hypothetical protein